MSARYRTRSCLEKILTRAARPPIRSWIHTTSASKTTTIPPSSLSYHWESSCPTDQQLEYASTFFSKRPAKFLWSSPTFRQMDFGITPEVCFLGRSNVGKSSLLNSILLRQLAHTSSKPGRTRTMNAYGIGDVGQGTNRLVILDMPGYGKAARGEWGYEIMKYLNKRTELKRAFLLVNAHHGFTSLDKQLLEMMRVDGIPHQVLLSKVDTLLFQNKNRSNRELADNRLHDLRSVLERYRDEIEAQSDGDGPFGELIACSAQKGLNGAYLGIDAVRHAILQAAGLEMKTVLKKEPPVEIVPHDIVFGYGNGSTF